MRPTVSDEIKMMLDGESKVFWGSGLSTGDFNRIYEYTPLRQNIVLFCAAMNGEL